MDIFISYRRGGIDQPYASHIYDYLRGLGYRVYYDRDEAANQTGAQFPESITTSLQKCSVIIALIAESWIANSGRLGSQDDWVRKELLEAAPDRGRSFLPIYISKQPADIPATLPAELQFIRTTQTHFIWPEFEAPQKHQLRSKLRELLPRPRARAAASDWDRPELLCDRTRALRAFDDALHYRPEADRAGGWLLFGEKNQGQHAIFQRVEKEFSLPDSTYSQSYPYPLFVDLQLQAFGNSGAEELHRHIYSRLSATLQGATVRSFAQWYGLLPKQTSPAVLYSVVHVETKTAAQAWIARFKEIHGELPAISTEGPTLIWALSVSYSGGRSGLLSRFIRTRRLHRFFMSQYPDLFKEEEGRDIARAAETAQRPAFSRSRLTSARESDVTDWYENVYVRDRVLEIPKDKFTGQFAQRPQLPMESVTEHLKRVLLEHESRERTGELRK